jgi:ABC-type transport system involved in multi-copper enzyme maturation permease subunit
MSTTTSGPTTSPARSGATVAESAAPSMARLVRVELRKSYDTRAGFWLIVAIGVTSLGAVALRMFVDAGESRTFGDFLSITQWPVGLLLPILGILLVTSEWSQRTALTTFALVPHRSRVLTAKVAAASVLAMGGVVVTAVASAVGTVLTPVLTSGSAHWEVTGGQVGQVTAVEVLYVLMGVAFGMALLRSPAAIVLYFLLPSLITFVVTVAQSLDWLREWFDLSTTTTPMYDGALRGDGWTHLAASLAVWLVVPFVIGWLRIERGEID